MPSSLESPQSVEFKSVSIELLITDASLGLTLLDLAQTTDSADARSRLIRDARAAYESIVSARPQSVPTEEQQHTLDEKLGLLRARLLDVGVAV